MGRFRAHNAAARGRAAGLCAVVTLSLLGCGGTPPETPPSNVVRGSSPSPVPAAEYSDFAAAHNARIARLGRIASRGVVNFYFTDAEGDERFEQGDLNLRYEAPNRLAFVIKKVGETYVWIGADATRYWLIDLLSDETAAYVGRHDRLTLEKARRLTLPVAPQDLMTLLALRPMPASGGDVRRSQHSADLLLRVPAERPSGVRAEGDPSRYWIYRFSPETDRPRMIALVEGDGSEQRTLLIAQIDKYSQVRQSTVQPMPSRDDPWTASRVDITVPGEHDRMTIELDDMVARSSRPSVFSFESRVGALQPQRVVELDAADRFEADVPAMPPSPKRSDDRPAERTDPW